MLAAAQTTNETTRGEATKQVTAAGAVALLSAGSAGLATRLLASTEECKIYGDKKSYPVMLHPTQLVVDGSEAAGMVIGNLGGFLALTMLHLVACELLRHAQNFALKTVFRSRTEPFVRDVQGLLRFPGGPALLFQILYQGSSVGALQLLYSAPTAGLRVLGFVATVLCIAGPVAVLYTFTNDAPNNALLLIDARTAAYGKVKRNALHFLIGNGEWISRTDHNHWSLRYSAVVRPYRQGCLWFHFLQLASMLAISAVQAFTPTNYIACGHLKVASFCIIFVMLAVVVKIRPYARSRDTIVDVSVMVFQCIALLFMAIGYYREQPTDLLFEGATVLMVLGVVCILVKVLLDVICEVYVLIVCRRDRLQDEYFDSKKRKESTDSQTEVAIELAALSQHNELTMSSSYGDISEVCALSTSRDVHAKSSSNSFVKKVARLFSKPPKHSLSEEHLIETTELSEAFPMAGSTFRTSSPLSDGTTLSVAVEGGGCTPGVTPPSTSITPPPRPPPRLPGRGTAFGRGAGGIPLRRIGSNTSNGGRGRRASVADTMSRHGSLYSAKAGVDEHDVPELCRPRRGSACDVALVGGILIAEEMTSRPKRKGSVLSLAR